MAIVDNKSLFKIGYGLYVVTGSDGKRDLFVSAMQASRLGVRGRGLKRTIT